ncbi:hypothetical protein B0H14DRAFT_2726069, partial [Mycena olivaceomarginata]
MFVLLTFSRLLVSRKAHVRAFPPSPMFVLLTFSRLLVSSECVLFPISTSYPYPDCKTFHSFHYYPHHLFCLQPYREIWNEGLLQAWDS